MSSKGGRSVEFPILVRLRHWPSIGPAPITRFLASRARQMQAPFFHDFRGSYFSSNNWRVSDSNFHSKKLLLPSLLWFSVLSSRNPGTIVQLDSSAWRLLVKDASTAAAGSRTVFWFEFFSLVLLCFHFCIGSDASSWPARSIHFAGVKDVWTVFQWLLRSIILPLTVSTISWLKHLKATERISKKLKLNQLLL